MNTAPITGETDLRRLLAGLAPILMEYPRVIRTQAHNVSVPAGALLMFREDEGTTIIVETEDNTDEPAWAQITLHIHSSLEAVGLMAGISAALADRKIPCNIVSAYYHDHLFVPWAQRHEALTILQTLQSQYAN